MVSSRVVALLPQSFSQESLLTKAIETDISRHSSRLVIKVPLIGEFCIAVIYEKENQRTWKQPTSHLAWWHHSQSFLWTSHCLHRFVSHTSKHREIICSPQEVPINKIKLLPKMCKQTLKVHTMSYGCMSYRQVMWLQQLFSDWVHELELALALALALPGERHSCGSKRKEELGYGQ